MVEVASGGGWDTLVFPWAIAQPIAAMSGSSSVVERQLLFRLLNDFPLITSFLRKYDI
jgi:hypothetical protein